MVSRPVLRLVEVHWLMVEYKPSILNLRWLSEIFWWFVLNYHISTKNVCDNYCFRKLWNEKILGQKAKLCSETSTFGPTKNILVQSWKFRYVQNNFCHTQGPSKWMQTQKIVHTIWLQTYKVGKEKRVDGKLWAKSSSQRGHA